MMGWIVDAGGLRDRWICGYRAGDGRRFRSVRSSRGGGPGRRLSRSVARVVSVVLVAVGAGVVVGGRLVAHAVDHNAAYVAEVVADGPSLFWRLDDSGSTAADSSGAGRVGVY